MESFALVDRSRHAVREQILLIVEDREAADEMPWELRRRGHPVDVREMDDDGGARRTRAGPDPATGRPEIHRTGRTRIGEEGTVPIPFFKQSRLAEVAARYGVELLGPPPAQT